MFGPFSSNVSKMESMFEASFDTSSRAFLRMSEAEGSRLVSVTRSSVMAVHAPEKGVPTSRLVTLAEKALEPPPPCALDSSRDCCPLGGVMCDSALDTRSSSASPRTSPTASEVRFATKPPSSPPSFSPIDAPASGLFAMPPITSLSGPTSASPSGVATTLESMRPSASPALCAALWMALSIAGPDWFRRDTIFPSMTSITSCRASCAKFMTWSSSRWMPAGVEYVSILLMNPTIFSAMPLICVAKESMALLDSEEYSKHISW
mmetsp:Transcript_99015/g.280465  ORF Transcript_99015/g.280465 Transcript_99015/m.280465 type:complete len:263 (-) Transcript_99015:1793-2581(-)